MSPNLDVRRVSGLHETTETPPKSQRTAGALSDIGRMCSPSNGRHNLSNTACTSNPELLWSRSPRPSGTPTSSTRQTSGGIFDSEHALGKRYRSEPPEESFLFHMMMATDRSVQHRGRSDESMALREPSPSGGAGTQPEVPSNPQCGVPHDGTRHSLSSDTCTGCSGPSIPPPWPRIHWQSDAGSMRRTFAAPSGRIGVAEDAFLTAREDTSATQALLMGGGPVSGRGMPERSLRKSVSPSASGSADRSSQVVVPLSSLQWQALLPFPSATGSNLNPGALLGLGVEGSAGNPINKGSSTELTCEAGACTATSGDLAQSLMSYLPLSLPSRPQQLRRYQQGSLGMTSVHRVGRDGGKYRASLNATAAAAAVDAISAVLSASATATAAASAAAASAAAAAAAAAAASACASASAATSYAARAAAAAPASADSFAVATLFPPGGCTGFIAPHYVLSSTSADAFSQEATCAALPVAQSVALLMDVLHPSVAPVTRDTCLSLAALPDNTREDLLRHKCRRTGKGRSLLERVENAVALVSATNSLQALEMPL